LAAETRLMRTADCCAQSELARRNVFAPSFALFGQILPLCLFAPFCLVAILPFWLYILLIHKSMWER
jgi:hypothetical protein